MRQGCRLSRLVLCNDGAADFYTSRVKTHTLCRSRYHRYHRSTSSGVRHWCWKSVGPLNITLTTQLYVKMILAHSGVSGMLWLVSVVLMSPAQKRYLRSACMLMSAHVSEGLLRGLLARCRQPPQQVQALPLLPQPLLLP